MIRTFFILLFYTSAYGQVDPSKVKIVTKTYHACISSENESVSAAYPFILTPNKQLNKFINDTIQKIVRVERKNRSRKINCWDGIDLDSKPAESYITYQINLVNSRFISLTIQLDSYAGGGANGASHIFFPLTFDLKENKILKLKDAIINEFDSLIYESIINQLKQTNQNLITSFENEENLQTISNILSNSISLNKHGITVYWPLSYGHGETYADVTLSFDKFEGIFDKGFIGLIRQK
jgi:hypothetical protein